MEETVAFAKTYDYDTLKIGITVPVTLSSGEENVVFEAKIDTGAEKGKLLSGYNE